MGQDPPGGTFGADIDAELAWDIAMGNSDVTIAVLDTGIPLIEGTAILSHPDLDDQNRIILGLDFVDRDSLNGVRDDHCHGTLVTGIIAANTDNDSVGIAGVAGDCSILVVQIRGLHGTTSHGVFYRAMEYAVDNADIINFSGYIQPSQVIEDAVAYADNNNVLLVAAAGNDVDEPVDYPAAYSLEYPNVIAVGATGHDDVIAGYSSHGPEITVCAPGGSGNMIDEMNIFSTMPNYPVPLTESGVYEEDYDYVIGTSMAAPFVAGIAGLILSVDSSLEPHEVRTIIEDTAEDLGSVDFDNYYGHGRVNAFHALVAVAPPDAPTNLSIGVDMSHSTPRHSVLYWDASTHPDVEEYEVYRQVNHTGGYSVVGTTSETFYVDDDYYPTSWGLEGGSIHHVAYKVKAVDDTEQTSTFSSSVSDILSTVPDVQPPPDKAIPVNAEVLPTVTELLPGFPNPFNAMTELRFSVSRAANVRYTVFDILGRKVIEGNLGQRTQGYHTHSLDMNGMAAGVYFTQVQIGKYNSTQKIVLLK